MKFTNNSNAKKYIILRNFLGPDMLKAYDANHEKRNYETLRNFVGPDMLSCFDENNK